MESYPRSTEAFKRDVSADGGASLLAIMRGLWPYIWPADRRDLKLRVAAAMALLLAAKLATMPDTPDPRWTEYTSDVDVTFDAIEKDLQAALK